MFTTLKNKRVKLKQVQVSQHRIEGPPGTVVFSPSLSKHALLVKCANDTCLSVDRVQVEGKKETDALSFANGYLQGKVKVLAQGFFE